MKFPTAIKSFSPLEISLLIIFILYIVLPIQTPSFLAGFVESPIGMTTIFLVTISLFFYTHPMIAILYIFVAYELLRRSAKARGHVVFTEYTPSESKKSDEMKAMNPVVKETLEEELVEKMAPIGKSDLSVYTPSSFKPVAESVGTASVF